MEVEAAHDSPDGLDSLVVPRTLAIVCNGKRYEVTTKQVGISSVWAAALSGDANAAELPFDLNQDEKDNGIVHGEAVLQMVIDFLRYHDGSAPEIPAKPLRSKNMHDVLKDPWDAEFITKMSNRHLYLTIHFANRLGINSLLHIACARTASLIKGVPLERMRDALAV